jgi:hypothetical protein
VATAKYLDPIPLERQAAAVPDRHCSGPPSSCLTRLSEVWACNDVPDSPPPRVTSPPGLSGSLRSMRP